MSTLRGAAAGSNAGESDLAHLGLLRRLQARSRLRALELPMLERDLGGDGLLLDLGCGQGLAAIWLAQRHPRSQVVGVDLDQAKLEQAHALAGDLPNLRFVRSDLGVFCQGQEPDSVRGALLADVLSSMTSPDQDALLDRIARVLEPGGRLVILFVDTKPRLRAIATGLRSLVVCRVLRLSRSAGLFFSYRSGDSLKAALAARGLRVVRDEALSGFAPRRRLVGEKPRP